MAQYCAISCGAGKKSNDSNIDSLNNQNRVLGAHFTIVMIRNPQKSIGNYLGRYITQCCSTQAWCRFFTASAGSRALTHSCTLCQPGYL